jgi:hypothetical protein
MLRITVELLPGGDESRAETIATGTIANISGLAPLSNYACNFKTTGYAPLGLEPTDKTATIHGHHRSAGVLKLIYRALGAIGRGQG